MLRNARILFTLLLLSCIGLGAQAQTVTDSVRVWFEVEQSDVDPKFAHNSKDLAAFEQRVDSLLKSGCYLLRCAEVHGYASPEGPVDYNYRLSYQRAASIFNRLRQRLAIELLDSLTTHTFHGRDWVGLRQCVENDTVTPVRARVISVLDSILAEHAAGAHDESRDIRRLLALARGWPYRYMLREHFPSLRRSWLKIELVPCQPVIEPDKPQDSQPVTTVPVTVVTESDVTTPPTVTTESDSVTTPATDTVIDTVTDTVTDTIPDTVGDSIPTLPLEYMTLTYPFALRTNLLHDLLLIPNIGIEVALPGDWSLGAQWSYGWWTNMPKQDKYIHLYGGDVNVRKYFRPCGRNALCGQHLGIYGQMYSYDVKFTDYGYWGERWSWGAGLEYGISLPLTDRLNLDLTAGVGYLTGIYRKYWRNEGCDVWMATRRRQWIGPTKLEATLVWLLNFTRRVQKGGAQ